MKRSIFHDYLFSFDGHENLSGFFGNNAELHVALQKMFTCLPLFVGEFNFVQVYVLVS